MYSAIYFCFILTKLEFSWQMWLKVFSMKYNVNPSSGSAGRQTDSRTDMKELVGVFRDFAKAPKYFQRERNTL